MPERLPLTAAQAGIWAGQRLDPASPVYNAGEYADIAGPVDADLLIAALRQVFDSADALHARYTDGTACTLAGPVVDVERLDVSEPAALAYMRDRLATPVDLATGPLFHLALLRIAEDRWWLYVQVHHIAADGYAFALLIRRVAEVYTALCAGEPVTGGFKPLAAAVAADAAYDPAADREFWLARSAGRTDPVTLAAPGAEAAAAAPAGALRHTLALPASLEQDAADLGVTWADLAVAGFARYAARHTGAEEVVLGLPVANRLGSPALRVPCMWMNIVPLRVPVPHGTTVATVAGAVAAEIRATRRHTRYRYEWLRRDLRLVGGDKRLFGPVVNILPFDHELRFAGIPAVSHNISAGPVEDLSLVLHKRGGALVAELDAHPALYTAADLAAHADGWLSVLAGDADRPQWLDGGPLPAPPRTVLEAVADRTGAAVVHDGQTVTYEELRTRARGLAGALGPDVAGKPVAVLLPRGIDAVVAILGALYAGAAYQPVDPHGPAQRTAAVLADADPAAVVTTAEFAHLAGDRRVIAPSAARPFIPAPAAGPAYVIHTSGSTGTPNGVVVGHAALAQFVAGATARYGITAADRVLQFAPLHFDASVEEIFLTLCAGATLVVRTDAMLESVGRLLASCAEAGITVLDLPTAYWHELAYAVGSGAVRLPGCLRLVIIGGEAALPARVAQWRSAVGDSVTLLNTYGPTEATVVATVSTVGEGDVTIGLPLPGVRAAVLDGELYLAGDGLADGYLNRPEVTARRFTVLDGERVYRTGDRVRVGAGGDLVYAGRIDGEFKISGHRVDPAEVESALLAHPEVVDAAVVGDQSASGLKRLVAYVAPAVPDGLRTFVAERLPAALVPGQFVAVERIPRTSNTKVDRAALRAALPAATTAGPAGSTVERVVLDVLAEVLGAPVASADADFFELGGQSLQTIQVATRLSVALGQDVQAATVFRHPTAATLAAALTGDAGAVTPTHLRDAVFDLPVAGPAPTTGTVVLTGATGFVGRYLLRALLDRTTATVVCLVRASTADEATARLRAALIRAGADLPPGRVVAEPADLTRPLLGLTPARFAALAIAADAVYHAAAVVSVVRDYRSVRSANVDGTREILRLAATGRSSAVHHISTVAVLPPGGAPAGGWVPDHPGLRDGYQRSKWAAEELVRQAGERGLPVSVYRLGRVVAPADGTPDLNPDDLVWRILRAGLPAGVLPALDVAEPWTPVDLVASAVVGHAVSGPPAVLDLVPARAVALRDVFTWAADFGYPVRLLPVPGWVEAVRAAGTDDAGVLHFFDGPPPDAAAAPLIGAGEWPEVDRAAVHRVLALAVADGILPPAS